MTFASIYENFVIREYCHGHRVMLLLVEPISFENIFNKTIDRSFIN